MMSGSALVAATSALLASVLSSWMTIKSTGAASLPGCGAGSGCDTVLSGRWSRLGPIPVSLMGAIVYAMVAAGALAALLPETIRLHPSALVVSTASSWAAVLAAVWFVMLQLIIIKRFCFFCLSVHCMAVLAAIIVIATTNKTAPLAGDGLALALVMVGALAVGQALFPPRLYLVTRVSQTIEVPLVSHEIRKVEDQFFEPARPIAVKQVARIIKLYGDQTTFDLTSWPLIGRVDAANVLAALVDYTCTECHHLHRLLHQAIHKYPAQLAVVMVPVPLHKDCNPTIKCYDPEHGYACALARIAWALFLTDPVAFMAWDEFMAGDEEAKPYGLASMKAIELADISRFKIREPDSEVDAKIEQGVRIAIVAGEPKLPVVLMSGGILQGRVENVEALWKLLEPHLVKVKANAAVN